MTFYIFRKTAEHLKARMGAVLLLSLHISCGSDTTPQPEKIAVTPQLVAAYADPDAGKLPEEEYAKEKEKVKTALPLIRLVEEKYHLSSRSQIVQYCYQKALAGSLGNLSQQQVKPGFVLTLPCLSGPLPLEDRATAHTYPFQRPTEVLIQEKHIICPSWAETFLRDVDKNKKSNSLVTTAALLMLPLVYSRPETPSAAAPAHSHALTRWLITHGLSNPLDITIVAPNSNEIQPNKKEDYKLKWKETDPLLVKRSNLVCLGATDTNVVHTAALLLDFKKEANKLLEERCAPSINEIQLDQLDQQLEQLFKTTYSRLVATNDELNRSKRSNMSACITDPKMEQVLCYAWASLGLSALLPKDKAPVDPERRAYATHFGGDLNADHYKGIENQFIHMLAETSHLAAHNNNEREKWLQRGEMPGYIAGMIDYLKQEKTTLDTGYFEISKIRVDMHRALMIKPQKNLPELPRLEFVLEPGMACLNERVIRSLAVGSLRLFIDNELLREIARLQQTISAYADEAGQDDKLIKTLQKNHLLQEILDQTRSLADYQKEALLARKQKFEGLKGIWGTDAPNATVLGSKELQGDTVDALIADSKTKEVKQVKYKRVPVQKPLHEQEMSLKRKKSLTETRDGLTQLWSKYMKKESPSVVNGSKGGNNRKKQNKNNKNHKNSGKSAIDNTLRNERIDQYARENLIPFSTHHEAASQLLVKQLKQLKTQLRKVIKANNDRLAVRLKDALTDSQQEWIGLSELLPPPKKKKKKHATNGAKKTTPAQQQQNKHNNKQKKAVQAAESTHQQTQLEGKAATANKKHPKNRKNKQNNTAKAATKHLQSKQEATTVANKKQQSKRNNKQANADQPLATPQQTEPEETTIAFKPVLSKTQQKQQKKQLLAAKKQQQKQPKYSSSDLDDEKASPSPESLTDDEKTFLPTIPRNNPLGHAVQHGCEGCWSAVINLYANNGTLSDEEKANMQLSNLFGKVNAHNDTTAAALQGQPPYAPNFGKQPWKVHNPGLEVKEADCSPLICDRVRSYLSGEKEQNLLNSFRASLAGGHGYELAVALFLAQQKKTTLHIGRVIAVPSINNNAYLHECDIWEDGSANKKPLLIEIKFRPKKYWDAKQATDTAADQTAYWEKVIKQFKKHMDVASATGADICYYSNDNKMLLPKLQAEATRLKQKYAKRYADVKFQFYTFSELEKSYRASTGLASSGSQQPWQPINNTTPVASNEENFPTLTNNK